MRNHRSVGFVIIRSSTISMDFVLLVEGGTKIKRSSSNPLILKSKSSSRPPSIPLEKTGACPDDAALTLRMKRLQQAKALKQKANKQLEALGRRHLRDVRIVRKDMVYVTGMRMGSGDKEDVSGLVARCGIMMADVQGGFCFAL